MTTTATQPADRNQAGRQLSERETAIKASYVDGDISREDFRAQLSEVHAAKSALYGYGPCRCMACAAVRS
jgi:hypothetical protein